MPQDDLFYYAKRHQRELELSRQAASPEAAAAHRILAEIYLIEVKRLAGRADRNVAQTSFNTGHAQRA